MGQKGGATLVGNHNQSRKISKSKCLTHFFGAVAAGSSQQMSMNSEGEVESGDTSYTKPALFVSRITLVAEHMRWGLTVSSSPSSSVPADELDWTFRRELVREGWLAVRER